MTTDSQVGLLTHDLFVGVDGGGTKTQVLLGCLQDGVLRILGAGQGGPSNPRAIGFEQAFANIAHAIQSAFAAAGIAQQTCKRAVLCLAGAGREHEKLTVESWAKQSGLAVESRLVSEAEAILAAAEMDRDNFAQRQLADAPSADAPSADAPSADAASAHSTATIITDATREIGAAAEIALICGTGSLVWGRLVDSPAFARAGGWGYLLGDEGSGFWIGQQLLRLACLAADRRTEDVRLLEAVLKHLKLDGPSDIVQWCYGSGGGRERIAALAPLAFELQEIGGVAEIIAGGASELARMVVAVTQQLGCSSYSLAVGGSVVLHQRDYLEKILGCLSDLKRTPQSYTSVAQPVCGALQLAAR